jgi:hypothetical protein
MGEERGAHKLGRGAYKLGMSHINGERAVHGWGGAYGQEGVDERGKREWWRKEW